MKGIASGSWSSPLLCPDEATSEVLCPVLGSAVQKRQGIAGLESLE